MSSKPPKCFTSGDAIKSVLNAVGSLLRTEVSETVVMSKDDGSHKDSYRLSVPEMIKASLLRGLYD
jgi:hypothetical protein